MVEKPCPICVAPLRGATHIEELTKRRPRTEAPLTVVASHAPEIEDGPQKENLERGYTGISGQWLHAMPNSLNIA